MVAHHLRHGGKVEDRLCAASLTGRVGGEESHSGGLLKGGVVQWAVVAAPTVAVRRVRAQQLEVVRHAAEEQRKKKEKVPEKENTKEWCTEGSAVDGEGSRAEEGTQ